MGDSGLAGVAVSHDSAEIDLLSLKFEVGFETVCHRLSTLQRHGQRGIPFFFVRTDRSGRSDGTTPTRFAYAGSVTRVAS